MNLSRIEIWIAEHSIRIFLTIAALMIAGAFLLYHNLSLETATRERVNVLQPQVTQVVRAANICAGETALRKRLPSRRCAGRLRIALLNCRTHPSCRAALLAALQPPVTPKGVMRQHPSKTGQQPAPGQPGATTKRPPKAAAEPPVTAAPPASPQPEVPPGLRGNPALQTVCSHAGRAAPFCS